jgi:protein-S-isoprenylcysteine O-methyltransferase Ste14
MGANPRSPIASSRHLVIAYPPFGKYIPALARWAALPGGKAGRCEAVMNKYAKPVWLYLLYLAMSIVPLLLGWGVDDLGDFFRNAARTGYLVLVVLGSLTVFVPRLNVQPFSKGSQVVGRGLLRAYMVSGYLLLVFLPFADRRALVTFADLEALRWAGLALCLVGATTRVAGLWMLGRQFSGHVTLQENHQLVQTGVYRHVRHPMYLGAVIATAGLALVFRSWLVFPVVIWNLVFVLLRIGQEERVLSERFGSEFESYRCRTWRLLPYVY